MAFDVPGFPCHCGLSPKIINEKRSQSGSETWTKRRRRKPYSRLTVNHKQNRDCDYISIIKVGFMVKDVFIVLILIICFSMPDKDK
jgi:hypothetical protein